MFVSYDDQLRQYDVDFEDPGRVELFEKPNGRRVEFPLMAKADEAPSYKLAVLSIKGDWIEVG